jgi:glycosyltransferase involved in cell wall biosynthesis
MRIVEVLPSLDVGGAQTFCVNLCISLSEQANSQVFLVVFWDIVTPRFSSILDQSNVHVIFLHKKKGFSFFFLRSLRKTIKQIKPDVIHTHADSCLAYLLLLHNLHNIPFVHTITCNPGHYYKRLAIFFKKRANDFCWNLSFVAMTDSFVPIIERLYHTKNVFCIYNGIKIPEGVHRDAVVYSFIAVGRFSPEKRFDLLVKAFALCKSKESKLLLVGDGPEKGKILRLVQENGISGRVVFSGVVSNPFPLYRQAKFLVLPSLNEGSPLTILEAMSQGLPIIASRVGGIPDVVNSENGILFDPDCTPEELASVLDSCLKIDPQIYEQIHESNMRKSKRWEMKNVSRQYFALFSEREHK